MRILHIIPDLRKGGAERLVIDICNSLERQDCIHSKLITFRSDNDYRFLCSDINIEIVPARLVPSLSGKSDVNIGKLQKAIRDFAPDIIHSHLFESEVVLSGVDYPSATYFVHFHSKMKQYCNLCPSDVFRKQRLAELYEKRLVLAAYKKRPTEIIAVSHDVYDYVCTCLPGSLKKHLLHNAIDTARFMCKTHNRRIRDRLVTVGSLDDNKCQALAIETVHELHSQGRRTTLDIVGDGPNYGSLQSLIQEKRLERYVTLCGNVDCPELHLSASQVYFHTAHLESFGLVLLEAMAASLPVVCTDAKGNSDIIRDGDNGFLVKSRNPSDLAKAVSRLLDDAQLRTTMGSNAQRFSVAYDIEQYIQRLLSIYSTSRALVA